MKNGMRLLCGSLLLLVAAQSAEAKRFRIFSIPSFGGGETIDPVYDLPDEKPFVKDGKSFDVGYLNGRQGNAYVLYSGDRYRKLDPQDIALLTTMLGFDPTAKHRAQYAIDHADEIAEQQAEQAHKDERIAKGLMIEPRPGESQEAYAARRAAFIAEHRSTSSAAAPASGPAQSSGSSSSPSMGSFGFGLALILLATVIFAGRKFISGIFGLTRSVSRDIAGPDQQTGDTSAHLSFDARVAKRLAELQGDPAAAQGEAPYAPSLQQAPVRTFGRKA